MATSLASEYHFGDEITANKKALILVENSFVPLDVRVWYEATTLRDASWHVTVICPAPSGVHAETDRPVRNEAPVDLEGVNVIYFPLKSAQQGVAGYLTEYLTAFFNIARLTWRVWRQEHFDILHICNPPDMFFPLAFFYRLLGVGIIFDHHDLFPEFVNHRFHGAVGKLLYRLTLFMEYLTFRCADVILSVNESYRNIALKRGRISSEKNVVVRNGPKAKEFAPLAPQQDLKKGFPIFVCYLGIMGHEDGIWELIEAIRHVVLDLGRRDIFFYLIGDGALRAQALQQISAWGLGCCVEMPGMIGDKQIIKQYLSVADICLSPEPLSPLNANSTFIKVGEYMAMGKPVIAFDLRETRWTAQESAIYIPPGDIQRFAQAILELADHPQQRAAMGNYARRRFLECLSWEHQQENLLKAYHMALGQRSSAAVTKV